MNNESRGQRFPVSEKIYGALLRAYPPSHRAAYGAAMAQLFRDQCRDAWGESKNFGLLKLWLRVLPDLASTSIMERLAALNERKTMSDKLSNLAAFGPSPGKIFTRVFVTIFLVVVIISTAVTFILPEIYASSVALKMEQSGPVIDPYFRQTQYELMASDVILFPVIEKLDLNKVWGKKYSVREPLNTIETFKILKSRLEIRPDHGTKMTRITVYGDDRVEAAKIANAVAESYRDYRTKKLTDEENRLVIKNGWTLVEICIPAEPGTVPVKPNKPLNITIGALGGIFAAGIVGGLAALVTSIRRKRRQNANAPA